MKYVSIALGLLLFTGCGMKPYNTPQYVEVKNYETAFLIRLEGDNKSAEGQAKFASEEYLEANKVASKRVQITHRWSQTGRYESNGEWIPDVTLITVNRSPVTRLWTKDTTTGTSGKNEAVHAETKDSVNFSVGITCTAMITEADAAKFLYRYPQGSLETVMDSEVLGRIQNIVQKVANQYSADEIRGQKAAIQDAIETDLKKFYSERGITITNVGLYGGLSYENPAIQKAIDEAATAQNIKVVESAKLDAQKKTNERVVLEANGKAQARLIASEAEAKAIEQVNAALEKSKSNPLVLQFKLLEVQKAQMEKWDGKYPQWLMGGSGIMPPSIMLTPPTTEK